MKPALILTLLLCNFAALAKAPAESKRWSEKQASDWYGRQPQLVGCNYIPAYAINELEMRQARHITLCRGIAGNVRTPTANQPSGSTKSSNRTAHLTVRKRLS